MSQILNLDFVNNDENNIRHYNVPIVSHMYHFSDVVS